MFSAVAPRYDFLNRLLSGGRDRHWRKKAVDALAPENGERFLDVATGTADIAVEIACRQPSRIKVMGLDFSGPMLQLGQKKIDAGKLDDTISLQMGSGEQLPFAAGSFHGIICAFGIRNFANADAGLNEMFRVLKDKGRVVILEFSQPTHPLFASLYSIYFNFVLPRVGKQISRHKDAYDYLPQSVAKFPTRLEFAGLMENSGFQKVSFQDMTFGIVTLYQGIKNA